MAISARPSDGVTTRDPAGLEAVASEQLFLDCDRDRAIDAWIAEIYQAAMRPDGWHDFLVALAESLRLDPDVVVALANDEQELRHFAIDRQPERIALVRLAPNLRGAKHLRDRLGQLTLERDAGAQILDRLSVGVLLVDARARIVKTNRWADEILASCDGLGQRDGLEGANATDTAAMRNAIAAVAAAGADPAKRERLCLMRPSGARPWLIEITRVEREDAVGAWAPGTAAAAVIVSDGERATRPCPDALQTYYGLTRAESELATSLGAGLSLAQAATRRGVSRNTARGQLKRIFAKTQTNRQAELVRLVLSGPTGLASES